MSKNIDEIGLKCYATSFRGEDHLFVKWDDLKQAITERKLVQPMSYDTIYDILNRRKETHKAMLATGTPEKEIFHELTETLYQAQFGEDK